MIDVRLCDGNFSVGEMAELLEHETWTQNVVWSRQLSSHEERRGLYEMMHICVVQDKVARVTASSR